MRSSRVSYSSAIRSWAFWTTLNWAASNSIPPMHPPASVFPPSEPLQEYALEVLGLLDPQEGRVIPRLTPHRQDPAPGSGVGSRILQHPQEDLFAEMIGAGGSHEDPAGGQELHGPKA